MANTSVLNGLQLFNKDVVKIEKWPTSASMASKDGDLLSLDSAGRADDAAGGVILGVQVGSMVDAVDGHLIDGTAETASADDWVYVVTDLDAVFQAQIATGALTDPYTTRSSAAAFDVAGSAGAQYIDQTASTNDSLKIVGVGYEPNGERSAYGANQKVLCMLNALKSFRGVIS